MRTFLLTLVLLLPVARGFSQGVVGFYNGAGSRLSTNDLQGNVGFTTGVNAYRIGLYIGPAGTTDPLTFSLVGVATNFTGGVLDGRFGYPGEFQIPGNTGQTIAFQVRAWSLFAGLSHEDALLYPGPETVYAGTSTIGYTIPATGSASPPPLFGTSPGQVGGFTLVPIIPEPSTWALAVLGAGVLWFATRARRRKAFPPQRE
jgi:hypothetical protein